MSSGHFLLKRVMTPNNLIHFNKILEIFQILNLDYLNGINLTNL